MTEKVKSDHDVKDIADAYINYMFITADIVYGDCFRCWWSKEGMDIFYKWAESNGVEFTMKDLDIFKKGFKDPNK